MRLVAMIVFLTGVPMIAEAQESSKTQPPPRKVLSSENGRYVFGQISEYRRDQYLLDTKTGRLWVVASTKTDDGKDGMVVLQPVPYTSAAGTFSEEPPPVMLGSASK